MPQTAPPSEQRARKAETMCVSRLHAEATYPADACWAANFRRLLRAQLAYGQAAEAVDDVVLAADELFANAVKHGSQGPSDDVVVTMECDGNQLRIGVRDSSPLPPRAKSALPFDTNGRGLSIVANLSTAWGVDPASSPVGKTVWFTVDLNQGPADGERRSSAATTSPSGFVPWPVHDGTGADSTRRSSQGDSERDLPFRFTAGQPTPATPRMIAAETARLDAAGTTLRTAHVTAHLEPAS